MALFVVCLIGLSILGMQVRESRTFAAWETDLALRRALALSSGVLDAHPELLANLGGFLFERGRHAEAESLLKKAVELRPRDANALNNLAWLYARAPAPLFNPDLALLLARQAAEVSSEAHILDTLAEAYYANGRFREALDTIDQALNKAPSNREYFEQQKARFGKAAGAARQDRGGP
jgi:tetratricopeptide (TPR) repeat protein